MIYLFHGDNQFDSRQALNQSLDQLVDTEILRLDSKDATFDIVANFLATQSLFQTPKALVITNLFSQNSDKVIKLIQTSPIDVYLWQDKKLTLTQLKPFPKAKVRLFALPNQLFTCLNAIKPNNINQFSTLYHQMLESQPYDLFLYLAKNSLRKQLATYSKFDLKKLKQAYLYLVELDYQNKSGQLSIPKEIALERIIINLLT